MKAFPRIYSLSTLGLRHHQEFDYRFHPFRTDFIGESGCGKSMIADLLQLIIVGSEAFESATGALDERTPDGMVLRTKYSRGTELGYAFLNIQLSENEFLVIGSYLESSHKYAIPFIIQAGYDFDRLQPLAHPLLVSNFYVEDTIPTLDELKQHADSKNYFCKSFSHRKRYHEFLFKYRILSIDLTVSEKILKDYATIIQSFSRGETLEISKSSSLKSFLFGDEKGKELNRKYKAAVEELQSAVLDYGRNREEIQQITDKQRTLLELKKEKEEVTRLEIEWLSKNYLYHRQQEYDLTSKLKDLIDDFSLASMYLSAIKSVLQTELEDSQEKMISLMESVKEAKENSESAFGDYDKLTKLNQLLIKYQCSLKELQTQYEHNKIMSSHQNILFRIESEMKANGVWEFFKSFSKNNTSSILISAIQDERLSINSKIKKLQSFLGFLDINNEGTFGNWALKQKRPFDKKIESLIHHFSSTPIRNVITPKAGDKFILNPNHFIEATSITNDTDSGFWIQLGELQEFIEYIPHPIFTSENMNNLEAFLQNTSNNISNDIKKLEDEVITLNRLYEYVINEKEFGTFLNISKSQDDISLYKVDGELLAFNENFGYLQSIYKEKEIIEIRYQNYGLAYREAIKDQNDYERFIESISRTKKELDDMQNGRWTQDVEEIILLNNIPINEDNYHQTDIYLRDRLRKSNNKEKFILEIIGEYKPKLKTFDIKITQDGLDKAISDKETAKTQYEKKYGSIYKVDELPSEYNFPREEKSNFELKSELYKRSFDEVVKKFILDDSYKFQSIQDYVQLCTSILPEAFKAQEIEEESVIETIEKYLQSINEKNRELNKRKLQKIRTLMDEVSEEVSAIAYVSKQIDYFLNHNEREITGGHRARLKIDFSTEYPKDWISNFQARLSDENTLFAAIDEKLNETLSNHISLEEMLISAFYECGGHINMKPKVEKLLDPNSYIELTFQMESVATGQLNKGSTGQTYTAIALLCIARLSLIDKEGSRDQKGIRFMPIDEAESLGSNYDMLYNIARKFDYQIISMSINPLGKFNENDQYLYILNKNIQSTEDINIQPFAVFCEADKLNLRLNQELNN